MTMYINIYIKSHQIAVFAFIISRFMYKIKRGGGGRKKKREENRRKKERNRISQQ